MFRRSSDPLALSEASLLALRPALNAPVLNADFLPVGPARAAIVAFAEEYGGIGLAIGVRSNEGGQIAVFRNQEPIDASMKIVDALEPALATAEQMGFLFDEDMVESASGGKGRADAMALWGRLMGELEIPTSSDIDSASATNEAILDTSDQGGSSAAGEDDELLLDDLALFDSEEISLDLEDELPPSMPSPPPQQLSKFRNSTTGQTGPVDDSSTVAVGTSALGRIPIVRVRRDGSKRVPFIARLLSSF
jgi:hypothetical protein